METVAQDETADFSDGYSISHTGKAKPEILPTWDASESQEANLAFPYGMRIERDDATMLVICGTAWMDGHRNTPPPEDFRAQAWQTLRNISAVLEAEGATWRDVVRTTCFARDIHRDYDEFHDVQHRFYKEMGLDPLPASTGVQTRLRRQDLLVEIEAIAMLPHKGG